MKSSSRRAFTLVELLVVIAIIGVLVGLLLPAINAAREKARQATCTNNLRELALGVTSYATSGKSYPGWMQLVKLDKSAVDQYAPTNNVVDIEVSWAARILPNMDRQGLWESLTNGQLTPTNNAGASQIDSQLTRQEIYICPSDARTSATLPGLSYVANTGGPDVAPNVNRPAMPGSDSKANGIFHNAVTGYQGPSVRAGSADIKDGSDVTLLLSENVNRDEGGAPGAQYTNTWLRSSALFASSPDIGEQAFGMVWVYDQNSPNAPSPLNAQAQLNREGVNPPTNFTNTGSFYARPASEHPDLFVVAFCGGNTKTISQDIEYRVYQQLLTPNGSKCVWTKDPTVNLSNVAPPFRNIGKQLSSADY